MDEHTATATVSRISKQLGNQSSPDHRLRDLALLMSSVRPQQLQYDGLDLSMCENPLISAGLVNMPFLREFII